VDDLDLEEMWGSGVNPQSKDNRLRRITGTLGFLGLCSWFTAMYLYFRWYETLPRNPVVSTGNIYPYNFHGIAIYLTHAQQMTVKALEVAAFVLFLSAVILEAAWRRRVRGSIWRNSPRKPSWLPEGIQEESEADTQATVRARLKEVRK
jgi:hypothetical protein